MTTLLRILKGPRLYSTIQLTWENDRDQTYWAIALLPYVRAGGDGATKWIEVGWLVIEWCTILHKKP